MFALPILGGLGLLAGGVVGLVVSSVVGRTRFAGPMSTHAAGIAVAIGVAVGGVSGLAAAVRFEANSRPRVLETSGAVQRMSGASTLSPLTEAVVAFHRYPDSATSLVWRGGPVHVVVDEDVLTIADDSHVLDQVDLGGLDYVREVHAAVGNLERGGGQWLAVLVRLRATGRRELLVLYDPEGIRAHRELLERTRSGPGPVLWTAGVPGERQEFVLDLGERIRLTGPKGDRFP